MRCSDWSSHVGSSDLHAAWVGQALDEDRLGPRRHRAAHGVDVVHVDEVGVPVELLEGLADVVDRAAVEPRRRDEAVAGLHEREEGEDLRGVTAGAAGAAAPVLEVRADEHTSELQSQMRHSYALFLWQNKLRAQSLALAAIER